MGALAILDFGSQYSQLIARRLREVKVYCELFAYDAPAEAVTALKPAGFVLSGGPASVYEPGAPQIPGYVLESGLPILGICYGMQALTHALGGRVAPASEREYGQAEIEIIQSSALLDDSARTVWMSHGDRIETPPNGFSVLAQSPNSPIAAMMDPARRRFGLQFHPEVRHTPNGHAILRAFAVDVCGLQPDWTPGAIVQAAVRTVQEQVGGDRVLAAVSGGVDSTVAAAIVHRAVGDQLTCIFVNSGLLRQNEAGAVVAAFRETLRAKLRAIDATETFLEALQGIEDPEEKRRVIGETFIRVFEKESGSPGEIPFLVQGTIYPDVVESSDPERGVSARIKTHHNVGGLPADLEFKLVEPLRKLFKDEVRQIGETLGLPDEILWRQPFPGPGLAIRCLGEVSHARLERLRTADSIVTDELRDAGLLRDGTAQAFAVLLPIRSVGVMGDQRTYGETVAIRAVTTEDFMTADWARLPPDLLGRLSSRIVNEVEGVNRVVYDITTKPPATIEWE